MTLPEPTRLRRLLLFIKKQFLELFPEYQVKIYEPLSSELAPRQVWIALPDLNVDEQARTSGGEVPMVFSILVNVMYDNTDGSPQSEAHYLDVADTRVEFGATLEACGLFASALDMILTLEGETTSMTEEYVVSGLLLNVQWKQPTPVIQGGIP